IVGAGQEVSDITIALARAATATLHGIVRSSGQASLGPFIVVTAQELSGPQAYGRTAMANAASDGSFAIAGLLPGTYLIEARSMMGSESASTEVAVGGSDVNGVTLIVSQGNSARGRITFDAGKPPQGLRPSQVFIGATPVDHQRGAMDLRGSPPVAH